MKYWYHAFIIVVSISVTLLVTYTPERKIPSDETIAKTIIGQQLNKIEDNQVRKEISESILGLHQELNYKRAIERQKKDQKLDIVIYLMVALIPISFIAMNQRKKSKDSNQADLTTPDAARPTS